MIARAAEWLALAGLYLLLVGQAPLAEGVAAAAAAGLVIVYRVFLLRRVRAVAVEARLWLMAVPGMAWSLARDAVLVGLALSGALCRREVPLGGFTAAPLADRTSDPAARGRRALAVFAGSLAPNRYVVALSRPRARMISHRFAGGGSS
ncbi:MAG TPA: hypothetical protein VE993_21520 [Stellaceae bacterium]|nr:hypothetical protein [Stellaceae bacterium]